jgi:hypothetical protein
MLFLLPFFFFLSVAQKPATRGRRGQEDFSTGPLSLLNSVDYYFSIEFAGSHRCELTPMPPCTNVWALSSHEELLRQELKLKSLGLSFLQRTIAMQKSRLLWLSEGKLPRSFFMSITTPGDVTLSDGLQTITHGCGTLKVLLQCRFWFCFWSLGNGCRYSSWTHLCLIA